MTTMETMEARRLFAAVTGLMLMNADTDGAIQPFHAGVTLNLATLPTRELNVRADAKGAAKRIKFTLDASRPRNDTVRPFAMAGDDTGNYRSWTPTVGNHVLRINAFDSIGRRIDQRTVSFKVIDQPVQPAPNPNPNPNPTPAPNPAPNPNPNQPAPPIAGNWQLKFDENFSQALDAKTWSYRYWWNGDTGDNGEMEVYHPSAVTVKDGKLNITATKQQRVGWDGEAYPYTSGLITTGGIEDKAAPGYAFKYGYVEARMKLPKGQGIWPAFWMLPASYRDGNGEIDIMEMIGSDPKILETHYHVHGDDYGEATNTGVDLSQDFHTYGVDWQQGSITWYLDGKKVFQVNQKVVAEPMYLMLNVAVGGNWPGAPDPSTKFPATMQVDYVKVWQKAP